MPDKGKSKSGSSKKGDKKKREERLKKIAFIRATNVLLSTQRIPQLIIGKQLKL